MPGGSAYGQNDFKRGIAFKKTANRRRLASDKSAATRMPAGASCGCGRLFEGNISAPMLGQNRAISHGCVKCEKCNVKRRTFHGFLLPATRRGSHACGCSRLFAENAFRSDAQPKPRDSKPWTRKMRKMQRQTPASLARRLLLPVADHIYGRRGVAGKTPRQMHPIISLAAAPEKAFAKTRVLRRVRCTPHPQAFPSASLKRHRFSPPGRRQFTDAAKGLHTLLRPLRRFLSCVCIFAMQVAVASPSQRRNKNLRTR